MLVKANCPNCRTTRNAESQNYLNYLLGSGPDQVGCLGIFVHVILILLTGPFWVGVMVCIGFGYGTKYFCVNCDCQIDKSDLLL